MTRIALVCALTATAAASLTAQSRLSAGSFNTLDAPSAAMSSSTERTESAEAVSAAIAPVPVMAPRKGPWVQQPTITASVSTFGPGFEFSVPLGVRTALRAGYHGMSFTHAFESNGVPFNMNVDSKAGALQLDYAPFGGNFRISPGLLVVNSINANAVAIVAGGTKLDLGNGEYTSSKADPLKATAKMNFGYNMSPMLTAGFRSILPRRWNLMMPVEFGAVYNGGPKFGLDLQGSACDSNGYCGKISTNPTAVQDIAREKKVWADSISKFTFLPVVSVGVGYRFGGAGRTR